jgi:DNA helicase-2/ATP-dependent DNA helicase PcrA
MDSHDGVSLSGDSLLDGLTEPQRQAVMHVEGPLLVLAGAGSGKTRVITRRIAYLIQRVGIAPWNVLAITFTNKAAGEMRHRVSQLVTERQARSATLSTFHSLCARLIREHADRLGLPPGFSIYDTDDQTRAMKQALTALEINASNFPAPKVLSAISHAKNELQDAAAYEAAAGDYYGRVVAQLFKKYQSILKQNNALDFDDLLLQSVELVRDNPDVQAELRKRFQYILIDEYQDTNHAQFVLAHALAAEHQNFCATGDPDQSIYGWRGANLRNILEFEKHYPDVTVVRLEQNYRSTKNILAVADTLIRRNKHRRHKSLWTENPTGAPVRVVMCSDERDEAKWVVDWFTKLRDEHQMLWKQMAVFYRVNSVSRVVEDAFRAANIPYQIARGTAFYDRVEIKDALAYLRVIANPADEISLVRIVNTPARGISPATVKAMQAHAVSQGVGLLRVLSRPAEVASLNARAVVAVQRFFKQMIRWRRMSGFSGIDAELDSFPRDGSSSSRASVPAGTGQRVEADTAFSLRMLVEGVLRESGLEELYRNDPSDPDHERLMNLGELVSAAQQFETQLEEKQVDGTLPRVSDKLLGYLEQVSLVSDVDAVDPDRGAVTLMTLHAAKGLEFPAVAMIAVEDGLLPHSRSHLSEMGIEEERRLCFVGITRSQRVLAVTHARYRTVAGMVQPTIPSRFLDELPKGHVQVEETSGEDGPVSRGFGRARFPEGGRAADHDVDEDQSLTPRLPRGVLVRHPTFGLGRVLEVRPAGPQTRARVEFQTVGIKTLILQYAHLQVVSS